MDAHLVESLRHFLSAAPCIEAAKPLRKSCVVRLTVEASTFTLRKRPEGGLSLESADASDPDLSFAMKAPALELLINNDAKDAGDLSILFLKCLADSNTDTRIQPSIHIGPLEFVTKGYIGLFGVGGKRLMGELATLGFGSLGKIKKLISRLRTNA